MAIKNHLMILCCKSLSMITVTIFLSITSYFKGIFCLCQLSTIVTCLYYYAICDLASWVVDENLVSNKSAKIGVQGNFHWRLSAFVQRFGSKHSNHLNMLLNNLFSNGPWMNCYRYNQSRQPWSMSAVQAVAVSVRPFQQGTNNFRSYCTRREGK